MINARVPPHAQEDSTTGAAIAGMSVNGIGCAHRPWSLTPQFFANKPLDLLLRPGVRADMCNRFTLGRRLDEVSSDGGALWLSALALAVCAQEGMAPRFKHLDTTSFALTGASIPDRDAHAIAMTPGDAKDHRPDVPQAL